MVKRAHEEYIETLCGITITPEEDMLITVKLPKTKKQEKRQSPVYDEDTIFNNEEVINKIKVFFESQTIIQLVNTYDSLNHWRMPRPIAEILGMPNYLYDQFDLFSVGIKSRSITPLMYIIKEEIIKKTVKQLKTQIAVSSEGQTWEEFIINEH